METVQIKCQGAGTLDISLMKEFQGELKSLSKEAYAMLRKEILETGFAFPIHIWKEVKDDCTTYYIVGGHQRKYTLTEMQNEGIEVPPIPVVYVEADNYQQAKRRVLQDIAQYGMVVGQGLYDFMIDANFTPGDLAESFKIPDLNLPSFNSQFFLDDVNGEVKGDKDGSKEMGEEDFSEFQQKCPRCGFEFD